MPLVNIWTATFFTIYSSVQLLIAQRTSDSIFTILFFSAKSSFLGFAFGFGFGASVNTSSGSCTSSGGGAFVGPFSLPFLLGSAGTLNEDEDSRRCRFAGPGLAPFDCRDAELATRLRSVPFAVKMGGGLRGVGSSGRGRRRWFVGGGFVVMRATES